MKLLLNEMVAALKQPNVVAIGINIDTYCDILFFSQAWPYFNWSTDTELILQRRYATFKLNPSKYIEVFPSNLNFPIDEFKIIRKE